ncbi:MAG: baseplate assembly protein, partial [Rhodocyclaceae bacterium]|nr:baseplate assembly protein [Rhodocyclaceae bacterium]
MSVIDLSHLPPPAVVETLDYEAILASLKADLSARLPELAPVLQLESEPLVKLLQVAAWRELVLRQRINEAAKSQLLAFATGSDLDHLAAFYGVARLPQEDDEALRGRVRARIMGFANAG